MRRIIIFHSVLILLFLFLASPSLIPNIAQGQYYAPTCTGLQAVPSSINSGQSSNLTILGCTNQYPGPVPTPYNWPAPAVGTVTPLGGNTARYDSPAETCTSSVQPEVEVYGAGGNNTYSTTITINTQFTVSGAVYRDDGFNNCTSGASAVNNLGILSLYRGGNNLGSDSVDVSGNYSITATTTCTNHHLIFSGATGYEVKAVRPDGGSWTTSGLSGADYGPFSFPPSHTVDWCISNVRPWFQTDRGDVRMNNITNPVPAGLYASTEPTYPSVFISNGATLDFVNGSASPVGWTITNEYSRNSKSSSALGSFSYTFYKSRAAQNNITPTALCASSLNNCSISGLADGQIYEINGDVRITNFAAFPANSHVIILVNGTTSIATDISVPAGQCNGNNCNLFVLASKGNITIEGSVGTTPGNTATQLEGIYSSEGSIILANLNDCPTADNRLNVAGTLIANASSPFSQSGGGSIQNNRSLCASDQTNPTYTVIFRPDFLTQLTDFYKASSSKWQEVQP